jgi:hypothetical protein
MLTMSGRRFRALPVVGATRREVLKARFARAVREAGDRHRRGDLNGASAAATVSRELRAFLHRMTGLRVEYMQIDAIAATELTVAAPLLTDLTDAQFNADSTVDVGTLADSAEELIRRWS